MAQRNRATVHVEALGIEGIAGNRVLSEVVGPSALARFDRDVLAQSGVTHIILLVGINDLGSQIAGSCRRQPRSSQVTGRSSSARTRTASR